MSRFFVDDPPVPIYEFPPGETVLDENSKPVRPAVIWIKARMDVETTAKVQDATLAMGKNNQAEIRIGENGLALLIHNIVKWEGPGFDDMPCTPERIKRLNPNEPLIAAVIQEIAIRNRTTPSPNPPSPGTNGFMSDGERGLSLVMQAAQPSGNGTGRSRTPRGSDGRRNK